MAKNEKWKKASVIGSLWASLEILVGSFLHNIGFPLAGTVLSMSSVIILVSFLQLWPEKGIIWRASLITAILKSVSPSAVILGPMTGILTEGLLIELAILFFGTNFIGALIGGAFAVFSTIIHKVLTLIILYGFDLIKILEYLYYFAVKQIGLEQLSAMHLLIILGTIYIMGGVMAAMLGYFYGRKYVLSEKYTQKISLSNKKNKDFFDNQFQKYSSLFLFLHLIAIVGVVYFISKQNIYLSFVIVFVYSTVVFLRYKNSLRHLKKFSFWAQALFITFAGALFWNVYKNGNIFHPSGIIAGLKLNLRAVVILVGFSAISVELRNPFVQSLLFKKGLRSLYQSVQLAFSSLPFILENTPPIKENIKKPFLLIKNMLELSELLYENYNLEKRQHYIISGGRQEGKTSFAASVIKKLIALNQSVGGFLSKPIYDEHNNCVAYRIESVGEDFSMELCSIKKHDGWPTIGRFYFNPLAIKFGEEKMIKSTAKFKFIDEVGRLELEKGGWSHLMANLNSTENTHYILLVRRDFVKDIQNEFSGLNFKIIDIKDYDIERFLNLLLK